MRSELFYKAKKAGMGNIYASIELVNAEDVHSAKQHMIGEEEIRKMKVRALVDTGARELTINEHIRAHLQLPVVGKKTCCLANGKAVKCDIVTGLEIRFLENQQPCRAIVLPGNEETLLGVMPLEILNVMIDPLRQELVPHPEDDSYASRIHTVFTPGFAECINSITLYNKLVRDFVDLHRKENLHKKENAGLPADSGSTPLPDLSRTVYAGD